MMKRNLVVFCVFCLCLSLVMSTGAFADEKGESFSNGFFTLTIPEELSALCEVEVRENGIHVYHAASKEADCGGYAFGLDLFAEPSDHAGMPGGQKIGELTTADDVLYDIVLSYPTDVQYDFSSEKSIEDYRKIYDAAEEIAKSAIGVGGTSFVYGAGTKGADLYSEVLQKHVQAITEQWDSGRLEQENMSFMYNLLRMGEGDALDRAGYIFCDINADGIDELLIGEIAEGEWKGIIYDIYTMVDRAPAHVVSGWDRNRYFFVKNTFLCNEYSSGAIESGWIVYDLAANSTELWPQVGFKLDGYENPDQPWFLAYGQEINDNEWENVTEDLWTERKAVFEEYERFDFSPLSTVAAPLV
ncbi:MAG: hypothetical protein IJ237_11705 [Oscillospiraceae bacterium]|nr:hypothetical protein [Oscillospiraceae bacterium]